MQSLSGRGIQSLSKPVFGMGVHLTEVQKVRWSEDIEILPVRGGTSHFMDIIGWEKKALAGVQFERIL